MKKWVSVCFVLVVLFASPNLADSVGYINLDQIFASYNKSEEITKRIKERRDEFQEKLKSREDEIAEAQKNGADEEKIKEMVEALQADLGPEQESIIKEESIEQQTLLNQIRTITNSVAEDFQVSVVLDKRVVFLGGVDLTGFVIEILNER